MLRFCVIVVVPATSALFRLRWRHLDRIPASGPAIVAVNHLSHADPFVVARAIWNSGRVPHFLAKESLFELPVAGRILTAAGQIPVQRSTAIAAQSLGAAVAALRRGEVVVIYPEGTVTRDDEFWPMVPKTGIARLIRQLPDVPVIPMGQWGVQDALDVYRRRLRPFPRKTVTVSVGEPIDVGQYVSGAETPESVRRLADVVMRAVRAEVADIRGATPPAAFSAQPVRRGGVAGVPAGCATGLDAGSGAGAHDLTAP